MTPYPLEKQTSQSVRTEHATSQTLCLGHVRLCASSTLVQLASCLRKADVPEVYHLGSGIFQSFLVTTVMWLSDTYSRNSLTAFFSPVGIAAIIVS